MIVQNLPSKSPAAAALSLFLSSSTGIKQSLLRRPQVLSMEIEGVVLIFVDRLCVLMVEV